MQKIVWLLASRKKTKNSIAIVNATLDDDTKTASGISNTKAMQNLISNSDEYVGAHFKNFGASDIVVKTGKRKKNV